MTIAAPILYVLCGVLLNSAIRDGFRRHIILGFILLFLAGALFFWAHIGATVTIPTPVIHPSPTPTH